MGLTKGYVSLQGLDRISKQSSNKQNEKKRGRQASESDDGKGK